jgi:hypothetical protein
MTHTRDSARAHGPRRGSDRKRPTHPPSLPWQRIAAQPARQATETPPYPSGTSHTTLSGGSVISAENGCPCQPVASASTPPMFPLFVPP